MSARMVAVIGMLAFVGGAATGQQSEPPAGPPAAEQPPATQTPPPAPRDGSRRPAADADVFIPTEELSADEEVTFPVDI